MKREAPAEASVNDDTAASPRKVHRYQPADSHRTAESVTIVGPVAGSIALAGSHTNVQTLVQMVLRQTPRINRMPLAEAAALMHHSTRHWLIKLGRPAEQRFVNITLETPLRELPPDAIIPVTDVASLRIESLVRDANKTQFTFSKAPSAELRSDFKYEDFLCAMVSGPAYILYDSDYKALLRPARVWICSTPGINFAYGRKDRRLFTEWHGTSLVIDEDASRRHMRRVWEHVLRVMDDDYSLHFAVLCAIGCGAFRGPFGNQVPLLWASALHEVLSTRVFRNIKAVFLSAPSFSQDNNFAAFTSFFQDNNNNNGAKKIRLPIIIIEDASMIAIASVLASVGARVGVLNPSDVEAMRRGWLGMYWDGGHIALEEILAMQTTLLVHHIGINPQLFATWRTLSLSE